MADGVASGRHLAIEDLELQSDVGQLAVRGVVDPSLLSTAAVVGIADVAAIDAAAQNNLEIRGELDLAKLAAMLPQRARDSRTM